MGKDKHSMRRRVHTTSHSEDPNNINKIPDDSSDEQNATLPNWLGYVLAILSIALYSGSSHGEFVFDDRVAIEDNPDVTNAEQRSIARVCGSISVTDPFVTGNYFPTVTVRHQLFRFSATISGEIPWVYHGLDTTHTVPSPS
eukprot:m.445352 g.445352  ORF g.445352 m.445352 type:complete len:142 (+) comp21493_c0_seq8:89-514(+)